ncbi:tyrosine-protein kinase SRK3-like [Mytilus californianus]|uniref:tyrosine-protein kinase SRK3-like n=1 Tax=Mytilus californianus TaxID=6549 RepID=UPI002245BB3E|nr:tyrosine-protein kinase SRK3-like [Mytilus californianus]
MANRDVLEKVERGYRPPQANKCPDKVHKIMLSCLHESPNNRPSFDFLFDFFDNYFVSAEPEEEVDLNQEQMHVDIKRILPTEITFDAKISNEKVVGEIWKGEWILKTRKPVCIKRFQQGSYQDFIREASIMKLCNHDKVIKLYGVTTTVDWIVMEVYYNWNLLEYMKIYQENEINFNQMIYIAAQVACGMDYLGTKRIIHKDLRAAKVLINDNHDTKISGFHFARVLKEDEDVYNPIHGEKFPIKWTAPEAALYGKFTFKSDVWSFGILLVELMTFGQIPYTGIANKELLERLEMGFQHEKPHNCPENVYKIMLSCWNKVPTNRPTFEYLFNYFDDYVVSAELQKEEIDKFRRSCKNNTDQIQIQSGKEDVIFSAH